MVKFIGQIFLIIVFYHFNICRIYSAISSFILDILCVFSQCVSFLSLFSFLISMARNLQVLLISKKTASDFNDFLDHFLFL